jgi:hypothetical protein
MTTIPPLVNTGLILDTPGLTNLERSILINHLIESLNDPDYTFICNYTWSLDIRHDGVS